MVGAWVLRVGVITGSDSGDFPPQAVNTDALTNKAAMKERMRLFFVISGRLSARKIENVNDRLVQ